MEHKLNAILHSIKKNQKIWIIASIAVALVSGVVATLLTAEAVANSTAKSSITQTKLYLDTVTDAAQTSQAPKEIHSAVTAVEKPTFPEVPLGDISEQYRMARTFHKEIIEKVDLFIQHIDSYAQLQEFDQKYKDLTTRLNQLPLTDSEDRYEVLKDINALISDTKAPTDFGEKFTEVGRVYTSMERNWEAMMTARKMDNNEAYDMLYRQYTMASAQIPRVQTDVTDYVDRVDEKVESMVNDLKRYREEL